MHVPAEARLVKCGCRSSMWWGLHVSALPFGLPLLDAREVLACFKTHTAGKNQASDPLLLVLVFFQPPEEAECGVQVLLLVIVTLQMSAPVRSHQR